VINSAEVLTAEYDERWATTSALRREESHQALIRTLTRVLHARRQIAWADAAVRAGILA